MQTRGRKQVRCTKTERKNNNTTALDQPLTYTEVFGRVQNDEELHNSASDEVSKSDAGAYGIVD